MSPLNELILYKKNASAGFNFFFKEHTEPGSTDPPPPTPPPPSQFAPPKRLSPPASCTPLPYWLGNEREIKKQMKILELKKVNERIHQLRKKCLIIQTHGLRHYMK